MAEISSHVLDGSNGTHAAGVDVKLVHVASAAVVFRDETDSGGRLKKTVDPALVKPNEAYELVFTTSSYWTSRGVTSCQCINEIVLRFKISDPHARYHMPIIANPNSYSTWASIAE